MYKGQKNDKRKRNEIMDWIIEYMVMPDCGPCNLKKVKDEYWNPQRNIISNQNDVKDKRNNCPHLQ